MCWTHEDFSCLSKRNRAKGSECEMKDFRYIWALGLIATGLIIMVPTLLVLYPETETTPDPWDAVPNDTEHTDHTSLFDGPFATGSEVTAACLNCHQDAAHEVM